MSNALISCGYLLLSTISFIFIGDIATKEALEWVIKEPKIVRAASIICRLMDDVVSNEFEQERGHVVLGIECYMKQYGVSKQEAHDEFRKQIMNAWKDKNKECNTP
uniref:Terpene synthase metal-binding domain-containing protein n=1 Tax=Quercus lobata TaxID=97700 RepID=A0A7N2MVS3_QUELO